MPNFLVLTKEHRNLVIKADFYLKFSLSGGSGYGFYNKVEGQGPVLVGSVGPHVLAVIEQQNAFVDDFYDLPEKDDTPCDDECQTAELLESQLFWNAVWDVIEAWHEKAEDPPPEVETPTPAPVPEDAIFKIQRRKVLSTGKIWYGFVWGDKGFVNFSTLSWAKAGVEELTKGFQNWATIPLGDTELLEEYPNV